MNAVNAVTAISLSYLKDTVFNNQISSISMESTEEIVSKLKFIGHIEREEKIDVRNVTRQPNNFYTKIARSIIYPDNRANALKFIREVLARSFELVEYHLATHKNMILCSRIVVDLFKAKQGLMNLKHTYSDDTKFCCDIDVQIELIASKLANFKEQFPSLFEEEKIEKVEPKIEPKNVKK